jgi:hypothetical protein
MAQRRETSGRVWWVHTSTWADAGADGATHTYAQLRCGPTQVRVAHRLTAGEAATLDPRDDTAHWEAGETTIRWADPEAAVAAARSAWRLVAGPNDLLCAEPPEQPQVPLAGPEAVLAGARRLRGTDAERGAAWRWLLLGNGYDLSGEAPDAPDELVMGRGANGSWSLAGTTRGAPRRRREPPPANVFPRLRPYRRDGD